MSESKTPSPADIERAGRALEPFRRLISPLLIGTDNIPTDRPLLFVGNHTIYGLLDVPFMFLELYRATGIRLRALGDHVHFRIPFWRDLLRNFGVVDGTRENCAALMADGQCVLVFPGGAREVAKRKGERYKLMWKERLGFVRLAVRHGCTIVPFSAVGADDAFDILVDANDLMKSPLGKLLRKLNVRADALLPLARGIGPTPIPRPERFYFQYARPISTAEFAGQDGDDDVCQALRTQVATAIESGIVDLKNVREKDPDRALAPRLAKALSLI